MLSSRFKKRRCSLVWSDVRGRLLAKLRSLIMMHGRGFEALPGIAAFRWGRPAKKVERDSIVNHVAKATKEWVLGWTTSHQVLNDHWTLSEVWKSPILPQGHICCVVVGHFETGQLAMNCTLETESFFCIWITLRGIAGEKQEKIPSTSLREQNQRKPNEAFLPAEFQWEENIHYLYLAYFYKVSPSCNFHSCILYCEVMWTNV